MVFSLTSPIHTLNDREELQKTEDTLEKICQDMKSSSSSSHELIDIEEVSKLQDTWERSFLQMFFSSDVSKSYTE